MKKVSLGIAVIAVAYIVSAVSSRAGDKRGLESPFDGKILIVSFDASRKGAILQDGSIRQLGERSFLVGMGVSVGDRGDWQMGQTIWVPVSEILQVIEYDGLEKYKEALQRYEEEDD